MAGVPGSGALPAFEDGVPPLPPEASGHAAEAAPINTQLALMLGQDVVAGLRLDVNRPLGNEKAFRNKIQGILNDPGSRNKIINELGLKKEGE